MKDVEILLEEIKTAMVQVMGDLMGSTSTDTAPTVASIRKSDIDYLDSIKYDVESVAEDVLWDPVYVVLNLCRSLLCRRSCSSQKHSAVSEVSKSGLIEAFLT